MYRDVHVRDVQGCIDMYTQSVAVALCCTAMYMCEILYVERYTYRDVHVYEVNALKRYPCGCGECTYVA